MTTHRQPRVRRTGSAARGCAAGPRRRGPRALAPALAFLVALVTAPSCGGDGPGTAAVPGGPAGAPDPRAKPADDGKVPAPAAGPAVVAVPLPTWTDVALEAGTQVTNHTGKPEQKDWLVSAMGGGTIGFDYDSDGDVDLCVVDGTMVNSEGVREYSDSMRTRLLRNDSDGTLKFTEVTKEAGIDIRAFGFGGASCDYDADGHPDFYVACWGRNFLMRNRGDGTFEDVTEKAGVLGDERDMSTACAWGDVNGDGLHDLYVANYSDQQALVDEFKALGKPGRSATWREIKVYVGPAPMPPQADRLYLQRPDHTFEEVTTTHLVSQKPLYGFQPVMSDLDNDGDLDIIVANDTHSNHLWVNDGKGVFHDRAITAAVAMNQDLMEQACMGVDVGDYDRDGWLDITITNFSHDYNIIYRNRTARSGKLVFQDASNVFGITQPSFLRLSWGVKFFDYDNDGWLDHMVACGHVYGEIAGFAATTGTSFRQRCQLLRNGGAPKYWLTDVTEKSGPAFEIERVWRGICFGDFDDDGDTDAYVAALNDKSALFRNDGGNRNSFVRIKLVGKGMQRDPAGARIHLTMPDGTVQIREIHHGDSFCSDGDDRELFGLGSLARAPKIEVKWRDGTTQTFTDVEARKAYVIEQGVNELRPDRLILK